MKMVWPALLLGSLIAETAGAHAPVEIQVVASDGSPFREIPVSSRDDSTRSYLQAEKGARYRVRVRNPTGERIGLVIAVDGRNIINGRKSELGRDEPMYVLDAGETETYAGWRASLDAVNEFYFTDWNDSYAEAFGDRSARGVIALAVFREVPAPAPAYQPYSSEDSSHSAAAASAPAAKAGSARRDESPGTGYGDRRVDHAVQVEFTAQEAADSRHFIKYEWRETLCSRQLLACAEQNRLWDESMVGFAPPPPGH